MDLSLVWHLPLCPARTLAVPSLGQNTLHWSMVFLRSLLRLSTILVGLVYRSVRLVSHNWWRKSVLDVLSIVEVYIYCRASHTGDACRGRERERERGISSELADMTCCELHLRCRHRHCRRRRCRCCRRCCCFWSSFSFSFSFLFLFVLSLPLS